MQAGDMNNPVEHDSGVVSLGDEEGVKQVLLDSIVGLWDVVNNLTRLQPTRRERYRVSIFGSARAGPGKFAYEETKRAAAALAELGCDIVIGGGPGLMKAANEGAAGKPERAKSIGIRIDLPFEQDEHLQRTPLILVGKMWPGLIEWARTALLSFDPPLANPEDIDIPQCVASADEAIALIRVHHDEVVREWQNTRTTG